MSSRKSGSFNVRYGLMIAVLTFMIAFLLSAYSSLLVKRLDVWYWAFFLLAAVIIIGVIFDIIGVAVAAANPAPLNARASRKMPGAAQATTLLKNADKVANFCNDVVGDISGTLSGGIGAALAIYLPIAVSAGVDWLPLALMSGMIAAITVGAKAACKTLAIAKADTIIYTVGRAIAFFQRIFPWRFLKNQSGKRKRK